MDTIKSTKHKKTAFITALCSSSPLYHANHQYCAHFTTTTPTLTAIKKPCPSLGYAPLASKSAFLNSSKFTSTKTHSAYNPYLQIGSVSQQGSSSIIVSQEGVVSNDSSSSSSPTTNTTTITNSESFYQPNTPAFDAYTAKDFLEFWFSPSNLRRDWYLRSKMNEDGWVPIDIIMNFNKIKELGSSVDHVKEQAATSNLVQWDPETMMIRPVDGLQAIWYGIETENQRTVVANYVPTEFLDRSILIPWFMRFGKVLYVEMPKKRTKKMSKKNMIMVEFESPASASDCEQNWSTVIPELAPYGQFQEEQNEPKAEPQAEPQAELQAEPQAEPQAELQAEPQADAATAVDAASEFLSDSSSKEISLPPLTIMVRKNYAVSVQKSKAANDRTIHIAEISGLPENCKFTELSQELKNDGKSFVFLKYNSGDPSCLVRYKVPYDAEKIVHEINGTPVPPPPEIRASLAESESPSTETTSALPKKSILGYDNLQARLITPEEQVEYWQEAMQVLEKKKFFLDQSKQGTVVHLDGIATDVKWGTLRKRVQDQCGDRIAYLTFNPGESFCQITFRRPEYAQQFVEMTGDNGIRFLGNLVYARILRGEELERYWRNASRTKDTRKATNRKEDGEEDNQEELGSPLSENPVPVSSEMI